MSNITYYVAILLMIIIGFFVVKKVAGCLIRSIITLILIAIIIAIYWLYLK